MKTKILRYGVYPRHNDVVTAYVELDRISDCLYYYLHEKNAHSDDEDMIVLVLKVGEVYFAEGTYRRSFINKRVSFANEFVAGFYEKVEEAIARGEHVPIMWVEVYRANGLDATPLIEHREKRVLMNLEKAEQLKRQRELKKQQEAENERTRLEEVKAKFIAGEMIATDDFLTLAKEAGMEIHIRTIGTFRRNTNEMNRSGSIRCHWYKGKRPPVLTGCQEAVVQYVKTLQPSTPR